MLNPSQINDGSCDCPDGSDEPGTAACAHLNSLSPPQPLAGSPSGTTNTTGAFPGFWCANVGHIGTYIPFMFVNDGICDYDLCCDGTEEYAGVGGVNCENRCDAMGRQYRRIEKEKQERLERAVKTRQTMVEEARKLWRQVEARISKHTSEIQQLRQKEESLGQKFEEAKVAEAKKITKLDGASGKLALLVDKAKARVNEMRSVLDKLLVQRNALQSKVADLEDILSRLKTEYNPNFNDDGVKAAAHSWEDYLARQDGDSGQQVSESEIRDALRDDNEASGIDWQSFEEPESTDTDILYSFEAYLPASLGDMIHHKLIMLRIWLIENGILADNPTASGESALVVAAREAYEAVSHEIESKQREVDSDTEDLEKDYGPDGIFRFLKDKCINTHSGEYEYELCWMSRTTQKSKKGHGRTDMGGFSRIEIHDSDEEHFDGKRLENGPRLVLKYEDGQGCWNGPKRSTDVWLACAETEEIWRVTEAEKCTYRMEVGTPAACDGVKQRERGPEPQPNHNEL